MVGSSLIVFVPQVILNALFFDYDLKKAVSDPRLHNQLSPNATVAEPDFDKVSVTCDGCCRAKGEKY